MKSTAPLTPTVVRLYQSGLTLEAVGKHTGICASSVRNVLRRAGVERRPPGHWTTPKGTLEYCARLYAEGRSTTSIAEELGVAASTVRRRLQRAGVQMRGRVERVCWKCEERRPRGEFRWIGGRYSRVCNQCEGEIA